MEFISLNLAAPFLLFGIGVDDTFVVLSSWHRSSPNLSVPERMGRYGYKRTILNRLTYIGLTSEYRYGSV